MVIAFIVIFFLHFWDTIHLAHRVRDLGEELDLVKKRLKPGPNLDVPPERLRPTRLE